MQTASKPHYNSERDKTATVPQQTPRVQWQARNPLAGSRDRPAEAPIPVYDADTLKLAGYLP